MRLKSLYGLRTALLQGELVLQSRVEVPVKVSSDRTMDRHTVMGKNTDIDTDTDTDRKTETDKKMIVYWTILRRCPQGTY